MLADYPFASRLGDRVRDLRRRQGLSQAQLAKPDLSDSYISLIESGKRMPSPSVIKVLAGRLGCSVDSLTCGVEEATLTELKTRFATARRALYTGRPEQALVQLTHLAASADLPAVAELHADVQYSTATALEALGRFDEAIAVLQQLLEAANLPDSQPHGPLTQTRPEASHADPSGSGTRKPEVSWAHWAALQLGLARCQRRAGDDTQAVRDAGAAFTTAALAAESGDLEPAEAAVQIGAVLVEVFTDTGEVLLARQTGARILQLAQDCGHPRARMQAYQQAVLVAETLGDLEKAAHWAERALHLLEADEEFRSATGWYERCAALLLRARPDQAERARDLLTQQLTRAAVSSTRPQTLAETLAALAEAELLLDHHDQAAAHARQALYTSGTGTSEGSTDDAAAQVPDRVRARALGVLASACARLGDRDEAIAALVRRAEILENDGPRRHAAQAWLHAADLLGPPHPASPDHGDIAARRLHYYQRALAAIGIQPHI